MNNRKHIASITISGLLALSALATTPGALAQAAKPDYEFEKCFGVAKAGKNDCQTAATSCAGTSSTDAQADAWIYVPSGTCEKISGGMHKPTTG